jgi:hypothetical protein
VFTGTRFTSGWDNTGWGIGGAQRNFAFRPKILASAFITREVGNEISPPQRTLSNIVFTYDLLHDLKKTGLF